MEPVAVVRLARFSQRFLYAASACNGVRSRLKYISRTVASEEDLRSVEESSRSSTESALSNVTHNFDIGSERFLPILRARTICGLTVRLSSQKDSTRVTSLI